MPGLRDAIGVAVWRIHPQAVRPADPCWLSPASLLRPSVLLHAPALPKVHFQRTVSTTDWAPILSQGGSVRSPGARGGNRVGRQPRARILARATGVSRQTIRKVLRDQRHDTFRTRQSSLRCPLGDPGSRVERLLPDRSGTMAVAESLRFWRFAARQAPDVWSRHDRLAPGKGHGPSGAEIARNLSQCPFCKPVHSRGAFRTILSVNSDEALSHSQPNALHGAGL